VQKDVNVTNRQEIHPRWEELAAFDLGRLSGEQWAAIAAHVTECDACSSLLDTAPQDGFVALLHAATAPTSAEPGLATPASADATTDPARTTASGEVPAVLAAHPRYRILGPLGSGGMGAVFKAEHILMERVVALKVLHPGLLGQPAAADRFCQEVRALARLAHPNIVTAFDAERVENVLFLVMEYVEGESLDRVLHRCGQLPVGLVTDWMRQVALGLQFAWDQGVIHRDLKTANLLLTPRGQVKILDFGLARLLGKTGGERGRTPDGSVLGTPDYMAPEQALDPKTADIRADLYSLGCTWYELLTGRPPFPDGTVLQQLLAHQDQTPRPVTDFRADVPPPICAILSRLLAKDPGQRFQTPGELLQALEPESQATTSSRRAGRGSGGTRFGMAAAGVGFLLVLLLGAGWYWLHSGRSGASRVERGRETDSGEGISPKEKDMRAGIPESEPRKQSARARAVAWLAANNTLGPASSIAEGTGRHLDAQLVPGKAFVLRLGRKLVKSGRPTILAGREDDFFTFELPDGVPAIGDLTTALAVTAEQSQEFHPDPPVRLSDLKIDQKRTLAGDRDVTGSMAYRVRTPVAGRLACRLTFMLGTLTRTHYWLLEEDRLAGQGELTFQFDPLQGDDKRRAGPTILFLDVCSFNEPGRKTKAFVLSNTLADLVIVQDAKEKK
jgi:serine/threonine protein kinase